MNILRIKDATGLAFDATRIYRATAWSDAPDRSGEQIDPTEFKFELPMPLLKNHDHTRIAGTVIAAEVIDNELQIEFRLLDTTEGRQAAAEIAGEALNAVSIGFTTDDKELIEISLVPVGMHQDAKITQRSIESEEVDDEEVAVVKKALRSVMDRLNKLQNLEQQLSPSPEPAQAGDSEPESAISKEKAMTGPAIHVKKQAPYSLSKFILGLSDPTARAEAGFEFEMSQETAIKSGKSTSTPMVPWSIVTKAATAQDSITAAAGTPPVDPGLSLARPANDDSLFTITSGAAFLQSLTSKLGIPTHQALAGAFYVPRLVGNVAPAWVARDAAVGATTASFDSIEAKPHTLGATVEIRRSALIDCRPMMDALLSQQLQLAMADALDKANLGAVTGSSANAPAGMLSQSKDGGTITDLASLQALSRKIEMLTGIAPRLAMGPALRDFLSTAAASATLTAIPALGQLQSSNALTFSPKLDTVDPTKSFVLAGDFAAVCHQVLFGGGVEIQINPYADSVYSKGAVLLRALVDADFLLTDETRLFRAAYAVPAPKP